MHHGHLTHRLGLLKSSILRLWHRLLHSSRQVDVVHRPPLFPQTCHLCAYARACSWIHYIYMPVTINFKCPGFHPLYRATVLAPPIDGPLAPPPPPITPEKSSRAPNKTNENIAIWSLPFSILGDWNEKLISAAVALCL